VAIAGGILSTIYLNINNKKKKGGWHMKGLRDFDGKSPCFWYAEKHYEKSVVYR